MYVVIPIWSFYKSTRFLRSGFFFFFSVYLSLRKYTSRSSPFSLSITKQKLTPIDLKEEELLRSLTNKPN